MNISLDDKRKAFDEYRTKWDTFNPIKKRELAVDSFHPDCQVSGPGVYAFVAGSKKFIEFLNLESVSRGIPPKEWKIPLPDFELLTLAINPHADVVVVVEGKAEYGLQYWSVISRAD